MAAARKRASGAVGGWRKGTWRAATACAGARASGCYARSLVLYLRGSPRFEISNRRRISGGPLTDLSVGLFDAARREESGGAN